MVNSIFSCYYNQDSNYNMQDQPKKIDWNQYSSDSDDSWLNSDQQEPESKHQQPSKVDPPKNQQQTTKSQNKQESKDTIKSEVKAQKKPQKINNQNQNRPKFPTDQEILEGMKNGEIPEDKTLKAVYVTPQHIQSVINKNQNIIRKKQFKQGFFILNFKNKESLIEFIQEKIKNKYRFRLQIFVASKKPEYADNKYSKDRRNDQRTYKDQRSNRDYKNKQQYKEKDTDNYKNKQSKHTKGDDKKQKQQNNFTIVDGKRIKIFHPEGKIQKISQRIKKQKIPTNFSKMYIEVQAQYLDYAQTVIKMCWSQFNFGLESNIIEAKYQPRQWVECVLKEKCEPAKIKRSIFVLGANTDQYFSKCQEKRSYVIGNPQDDGKESQFQQKQYFQLFKKHYNVISKKWDSWVIKAYHKNIAKLLRLSSLFAKGLPKNNVKLQIGQQQKIPFAILQIRDLMEQLPKKLRGKPDTSAAQNHLNA